MAAKKQTLSNALLNAVLTGAAYTSPSARYIALFTTAPDASTGGGGTEVTGGAYVRVAVTFSPAAAGSTANTAAVTFPVATASWGTVEAVAICDALTSGNQLYFGDLGTEKLVDIGDQLNFAVGAITVTES